MRVGLPEPNRARGAQAGVLPWRLPGTGLSSIGAGLAWNDFWRRLTGAWEMESERRRLFLWLPAMMSIGILLYFAADREPSLWAPVTGICLSAGGAIALRRRLVALHVCLALAAAFAGFAAATWRTAAIATPILDRMRIGQLSGYVESVEARDAGARLVLLVTAIAGVEPTRQPRRVRVNIKGGSIAPGDHISASARLLPPPGPARPGGYDFGRDAFFRGIGAVGSIPGKISLTPSPVAPPPGLAVSVAIDKARNALTQRIASVGGGQAGAMAAALVTGKRGLITETTNTDLRAAGIYHIVTCYPIIATAFCLFRQLEAT